jgi:hypothetical protein
MMATTHALVGMALFSAVGLVAPEHLPAAVAGAAAGGFFPDLDLLGNHRRTLHFPVAYAAGGVALGVVALAVPTTATVALAAFVASAAIHSAMDALGGGLEVKPWQATSDRAVYSHYHDRWISPRRWIRYDGAPEDVALAGVLAGALVLTFAGPIQTAALAFLAISVVYGLCRKPLVVAGEYLVDRLPADVLDRIPFQFTEDLS